MTTTRPEQPNPDLPHTTASRDRSIHFVINPLVTHVRARRQTAMEFVLDKFERHRVTAIGEQHQPSFGATGTENGCVRMFVRDLCQALHARPEARFRFLVVEFDEAALIDRFGHWQNAPAPPDIPNLKAWWLAENLAVSPALQAIYRAVERMPEVEVVGIDDRSAITYAPQREPHETDQQYQQRRDRVRNEWEQRYTELSHERDRNAADNFERMVLSRLGDDRVLIYYGANHLRETGDPGEHYYSGMTNRTFVRELIERDNGLSATDIYSIFSLWSANDRIARSLSAREHRQEIAHEVQLLRIFDILRAEFPDDRSLGFDVDEAEYALRPIDRSARYPLGERFDGCIYFRDLNSWDGQTQAPLPATPQPPESADLSITSVIPERAAPGNVIFVYGFVLTDSTQVTILTRTEGGQPAEYPCSHVHCVNDNLIRATVPSPGPSRFGGEHVTVRLTRAGAPPTEEPVELQFAFRYTLF